MGMYDDIVTGVSETVTIMGIPFYAEDITADEPVNRRERNFTSILGGTERVSKGKYIHRKFSFRTTVFFPTGRPDAHDKIFSEIMREPVEVISPYMGGKFNALVEISKSFPEASPNHIELDVDITEVPDKKSLIKGESFKVPSVKKIKTKNKVKTTTKSKSSSKNKSSKSKTKRNSKSKKSKSSK